MGNTTTRLPLLIVCTTPVSHTMGSRCRQAPRRVHRRHQGAARVLRPQPDYFEHQYIKRLDSGPDQLDPDWQEDIGKFRWWRGMRRS